MDLAQRVAAIRRDVVGLSYRARSAHLGSSLSCVEILDAVLEVSDLRPETAEAEDRDRIVVSKGHAAMAYYAALANHGLLSPELLDHYLDDDTVLWGHVTTTRAVPAIDFSSGSLGHGLGLAVGQALANRLKRVAARVFCVLSDGECNEGSVWEAAQFAAHHRLATVCAVVDYNKIQSIGFCRDVLDPEPFADKWAAFGWQVRACDGHDPAALRRALAPSDGRPLVILANTVKGKGIPRIENTVESHYKPATREDFDAVMGGVHA